MFYKNNFQSKGFTLVELIVVIIILAILGTISFIALQGYSSKARDSKRLSDISNIKTSLELFSLKTGYYPLPDDGQEVSYSGELLWTQGVVGSTVTTNLSRNMKKVPQNPIPEGEYTYSTINTQKKYELLSVYESELVSYDNNLLNTTNAASANYPKIDGTYNGLFVKAKTSYVPTPSLITSEDLSSGLILDETNITSQIITGGDNVPSIGITERKTEQLNIKLSVYTGGIITNDSTLVEKQALVAAIQGAYETSDLANTDIYKSVLNTTKASDIELFVEAVVINNGTTSVVIKSDCESGTIMGSTYDTVEYSYGEIFTGGTGTGTATVDDGSVSNYTSTITCDDGDVSISDEVEDTIILYAFTNHTFTNCTKTGQTGPSLSQCKSSYSTSWDENSDFLNMSTNGIQEWTIPETGTYTIDTYGAGVGSYGGGGARIKGDIELTKGDKIKILVGQLGYTDNASGIAGNGGTFVTDDSNNPLMIAGGGGGSYQSSRNMHSSGGSTTESGGNGYTYGGHALAGGSSGSGGGVMTHYSHCGNGGAGLTGNSTGAGTVAKSFVNGGVGGTYSYWGGFGGGGGTTSWCGGGGGGYSGGSGGYNGSHRTYGFGGGGGSYNAGTNQTNTGGTWTGHGKVIITKL